MASLVSFRRRVSQKHILKTLALHARQRGRDSSGLLIHDSESYRVERADYDIKRLLAKCGRLQSSFVMGHSRLITNGLSDNQPVVRDRVAVIYNGIIVNEEEVWAGLQVERKFLIDSETINAVAIQYIEQGKTIETLPDAILRSCKGTISSAIVIPRLGKLCLFSNNGSLYVGKQGGATYFSSERYPLEVVGCDDIEQVWQDGVILDIPQASEIRVSDDNRRTEDLIPVFNNIAAEEAMLVYPNHGLRRCTKCILPETMPYISFNDEGVCNYCNHYRARNNPKPRAELDALVAPYRRSSGPYWIVLFSGGRDSWWGEGQGLHLVVNELKMRPITRT